MKKTIYHGSDHIIEKPQYGYGKPYNDYGVGFYCTRQKGVNQESIRIPYGRRKTAAPWTASSVQNGHLMQPFCFL